MSVGADKAANLIRATASVKEAASNGAQVVALPVSIRNVQQNIGVDFSLA